MDDRYERLLAAGRRKITRDGGMAPVLVVFDELAYFSATVGDRKQQGEFVANVRDLVARGRAAGVIVVAATQRPSADIIPTSLRDLFGYRWAFRCTTGASSDVILGHGWAASGYSATDIDPPPAASAGSSPKAASPAGCTSAFLDRRPGRALATVAARHRASGRRRERRRRPGRRATAAAAWASTCRGAPGGAPGRSRRVGARPTTSRATARGAIRTAARQRRVSTTSAASDSRSCQCVGDGLPRRSHLGHSDDAGLARAVAGRGLRAAGSPAPRPPAGVCGRCGCGRRCCGPTRAPASCAGGRRSCRTRRTG